MAAVAQMVNVLQALILTDNEKMVLTPTYYVFDMYKVHQEAMMVPVELNTENYNYGDKSIPAIHMSSSISNDGKLNITICNTHATKDEILKCTLKGYNAKTIKGKIINGDKLDAHNTFDNPNRVKINEFNKAKLVKGEIEVTIPAHSVVALEISGDYAGKPLVDQPRNPKNGLKYTIYEGSWNKLPDFSSAKPLKSGVCENFTLPTDIPTTNSGIVYEGYILIENEGFYDFFTVSDDGSRLYIDDDVIVNNDGLHGMIEKSGNVFLKKGYHKIKVDFFQAGGGLGLNVLIQAPNGKKELINNKILYY